MRGGMDNIKKIIGDYEIFFQSAKSYEKCRHTY